MGLRSRTVLPLFILVMTECLPGFSADEKKGERDAAQLYVQNLLRDEASGTMVNRAKALSAALEETPKSEAVRWHAGYTRWKNQWVKFDSLADNQEHRATLEKYAEIRGKTPDTADAQVNLADWCRQRGLADQERSHLTRALVLQPNHSSARTRLGWQRIDGRWFQKEEIAEARDRAQEVKKALTTYSASLKKIIAAMTGKNPKERADAKSRLLAIDDPAVIPVLEQLLGKASDETKLCAIEVLARMSSPFAAQALAKIAVVDPFNSVGEAAATALSGKPEDQYVPALLSVVSSPIESRFVLYSPARGRLIYQHMFVREAEDHKEQLLVTRGVRTRTGPADPRLAAQLVSQAKDQESRVADANADIDHLNKRLFAVLSTATKQQLPDDPDAWWSWWYERNEVYLASAKPTFRSYQFSDTLVQTSPTSQPRHECLAAGTPIWTSAGSAAIDKMNVGDLVLAQDPKTGELAYKPVLQTTVRSPGPIIRIETEKDTIRTSGGHLFWIAGEGWVRSRILKPGMKIHDVEGATEILDVVDEGGSEPTYNLIVADFHTYFVGDAKVLSHDN